MQSTVDLLGVRWRATERPFGPPRPLGFSAALAFDALELECNRTIRRAVLGLIVVGASLALLVAGASGSSKAEEPAAASPPVSADADAPAPGS